MLHLLQKCIRHNTKFTMMKVLFNYFSPSASEAFAKCYLNGYTETGVPKDYVKNNCDTPLYLKPYGVYSITSANNCGRITTGAKKFIHGLEIAAECNTQSLSFDSSSAYLKYIKVADNVMATQTAFSVNGKNNQQMIIRCSCIGEYRNRRQFPPSCQVNHQEYNQLHRVNIRQQQVADSYHW